MDAGEERLRTMAEVISAGWHLFLRAFVRVFPLALLSQWAGLLDQLGSAPADATKALEQATSGSQFVLWAAVMLVQMFFMAAIICETAAVAEGRAEGSLLASLGQAVRAAVPLFVATVIFWAAVAIGLVFVVIPGFVVGAYLLLFPYTLVLEHRGAIASMGASFDLVDGNFWRVGMLLSIPTLGYLVAYAIESVPAVNTALRVMRSGSLSLGAMQGPRWFQFGLMPVLLAFSATLLWTMAYPVYTDLRQRKAPRRR